MALGLVSSAAVLTDALTLVPSPTDRDAMDLKERTKFTAIENYARGTLRLSPTQIQLVLISFFSVWFFSKNCLAFSVNFPLKPNLENP